MSAGDGFFSLQDSETSNNLKSKIHYLNEENDLIDNKGDNSESAKTWDNNFTERLANFMKNSKSLLENIDKKHPIVKFQTFENNNLSEKFNTAPPESPSIALIKLEETLMQLDDSKSKFIKTADNKGLIHHASIISPENIDKRDFVYDSNVLNDFNIPRINNVPLESDNYFSFPTYFCNQDCDERSSNLSLNKIEDSHIYDSEEMKEIVNVKHSRHLTYSGSTKLFQNESKFSKFVDFKLALYKKRTNSLKGINRNNVEEGMDYKCLQIDRSNGFQNVINALFNQNQSFNLSKTSPSDTTTKNNNLESAKLASSYIPKDVPPINQKSKNIYEDINENDFDSEKKEETLFLFNNKNCKMLRDRCSLSSNLSIEETFEELKKLSKESSHTSSKVSIFNMDNDNKMDKSEVCDKVTSYETNNSPVYPKSLSVDSLEVIKRSNDSNEKENILELPVAEKESSNSPPKKYISNKSHNFQEALRIDELENELNKMKYNLKEKDKKIIILENDSKQIYKTIATDVNTRCIEDQVVSEKKKIDLYKVRNFDNKSSGDILFNESKKILYGVENNVQSVSFTNPHQYSSIEDYNPNNSLALRNKIKDLESQIQDLQEANENASHFMSSFKEKHLTEINNNTNAIIAELIDKNQSLRDEVDRLRQSIPALKGDTISSQFLRQELENLKEDLYTLKHQNNLIIKENISLKTELKKRDNNYDSNIRHEDHKPVLYQISEHAKPNQSTCNGTYELNNHSNDRSDSDNSIDLLSNDHHSNSQVKSMSINNLSKDKSGGNGHKQPMKFCKVLPHSYKKKSDLFTTQNIHQFSEYDENQLNIEKHIDKMKNDNCSYEKDFMNLSNDSTDSILSDANKEIIFESDLEKNYSSRLAKYKNEKEYESDFQFETSVIKREGKIVEDDTDSAKNSKFSTLGKTAYAPRASFDVSIGDVVKFIRQGGRISRGLVHFVGPLPNRKDTYLGIELEIEDGKHDGIYEGKRYFQCIKNKGVFVAFNKIIMVYSKKICINI